MRAPETLQAMGRAAASRAHPGAAERLVQSAADVDVVRDLMIHDLDILQKLLGEEPETPLI